ncbi:hypothetical protein F5890DRAFT_1559775 [Lentinula detonsa]|uniref:Uncharacterized protein n=1 Tax=Lentinula detonsa TaxID=2804962 RepID=A0AA38PP61_9AGAR|nr:hypothetical protein F5890DRAFT_1559775 [Lentinula detonsa]
MSSTSNDNETIQQRRERILQAQAARQQAREEEVARQEAEFAAEMEKVEAEEKAAREAEERRKAEEKRIAEEKLAEERQLAEAMRLEEQRISELRRFEEEIVNENKRVAEENREGQEKTAKELEKRQKRTPSTKQRTVDVVVPSRPFGSKNKIFKSKSVISDDSDDAGAEKEREATPRGVKRKRATKMVAMGGKTPAMDDEFDPEDDSEDEDEEIASPISPSKTRSACSRCVMIGKSDECRPQSTRRRTQACELCHLQRQRCSWSGNNSSRRARGKRAKVEDDEVYTGPASRVASRSSGGSELVDRFDRVEQRLGALERYASRSAMALERIAATLETMGEKQYGIREKAEQEDEDGEGEEDEEENEVNKEKWKREIREGKKRAE